MVFDHEKKLEGSGDLSLPKLITRTVVVGCGSPSGRKGKKKDPEGLLKVLKKKKKTPLPFTKKKKKKN